MAFINLDSIHPYQPSPPAERLDKRLSAQCKHGVSTGSSEHNDLLAFTSSNTTLNNYDLPDCLDLTTSPPKESLDPLGEPALGFGGLEGCAQDPLPTGPHFTADGEDNDSPFPSINELLGNIGNTYGPQYTASNIDHGKSSADNAAGYPVLIDCNNAPAPATAQGGDTRKEIDSLSNSQQGGNSLTAGEQSVQRDSSSTSALSVPGPEARHPFPQNTPSAISDGPLPSPSPHSPLPPPSPPPPVNTVLSSISDPQTGSNDCAFKDIGSSPSEDGQKKADADGEHHGEGDEEDGDPSAADATGIRDSSKRKTEEAGLIDEGNGEQRPKKAQYTGSTASGTTCNLGDDLSDAEFARERAQKHVFKPPPQSYFRRPLEPRREDARHSDSTSGAGANKDDPFVVEDDDEEAVEPKASTKAASPQSEIGIAQRKPGSDLDTHLTAEPTTDPLGPPSSPSIHSPRDQSERPEHGDENEAAVASSLPTPPPPLQSEARIPAVGQDEWEIKKIVGKRPAGKGYEYKVRWKDTWLPRSELGHARRLLQEFKVQGRAQQGYQPRKATRADKSE